MSGLTRHSAHARTDAHRLMLDAAEGHGRPRAHHPEPDGMRIPDVCRPGDAHGVTRV